VALNGLAGAAMWTDAMPRESAARRLSIPVAADQVLPVRIYVVAPANSKAQSFAFDLKALDAEGGTDRSEVRFDAPEETP
jgi:hypothetical protein